MSTNTLDPKKLDDDTLLEQYRASIDFRELTKSTRELEQEIRRRLSLRTFLVNFYL